MSSSRMWWHSMDEANIVQYVIHGYVQEELGWAYVYKRRHQAIIWISLYL